MSPRLLVHIPHSSSTKAKERFRMRKRKRLRVAFSEKIVLEAGGKGRIVSYTIKAYKATEVRRYMEHRAD